MAGKEETPKCRKKTVTWSNEMIEDLIDFIQVERKIGCISISSKSVQFFLFKFLVWYTRSINILEFKKLEWRFGCKTIITTTCCAEMAGKEETPKCRKKTVTWSNEMIEDLIDFIEIHPIVFTN
jgi:hypothetical protein